jgi:hypothetical protein
VIEIGSMDQRLAWGSAARPSQLTTPSSSIWRAAASFAEHVLAGAGGPESDLYAESSDADTVIGYIKAHA